MSICRCSQLVLRPSTTRKNSNNDIGLHAFKMQLVQVDITFWLIKEEDFCRKLVLCSFEAHLLLNGSINRQKQSSSDQRITINSLGLTVWWNFQSLFISL